MEQFAGMIAGAIAVVAMESIHPRQAVARAVAAGGWLVCSIALSIGLLWVAALAAIAGTAVMIAAKSGEREWKRKLAQEKV